MDSPYLSEELFAPPDAERVRWYETADPDPEPDPEADPEADWEADPDFAPDFAPAAEAWHLGPEISDEADDVAEEGWAPDFEQEQAKPPPPEIILVAGADYPKFKQSGRVWNRVRTLSAGVWRDTCLRLARARLRADPRLKVTLFDFLRGTRENVTLDAAGQPVTSVEHALAAPVAADYWNVTGIDLSQPSGRALITAMLEPADTNRLTKKPQVLYWDGVTALSGGKPMNLLAYVNAKAPAPVISITDVYAYISGRAAGSVRELHLFAHAFTVSEGRYSGGPILLNSADDPTSGNRFRADKDARAAKDFRAPAMDPARFAQAFSIEARSFVWGCNFQRGFIRQFVHQVGRNRKTLESGRPMRISHHSDWGTPAEFRTRLGLGANARVSNVAVTPATVEQILRDANQASYMQALATASGRPVVGAPPGTYADYDGAGSPLRLLHVPMSRDPFRAADVSFENALLYFRDGAKFAFDTTFGNHNGLGRGYVVFDP